MDQEHLPGMPEPEPSLPTPGDLVKAWIDAFAEGQGQPPHPALVPRIAGTCKNIGRHCTTVDDWRDAWRAARAAGLAGRFDVAACLVPHPRSQYEPPMAPDMAFILRSLDGGKAIEQ